MDSDYLTIGAVSRACGVPVETLRTWERRYGVPAPTRSNGGQRLYAATVVEHLNSVKAVIDAGIRPAQALKLSPAELESSLGRSRPPAVPEPVPPALVNTTPQPDPTVLEWVRAAARLDPDALDHGLRSDWVRMGMFDFLESRLVPFIWQIGEAWARDEIGVVHEHFASDRVTEFLGSLWRPLSDRATGPRLIGSTLPTEQHALGLHMAALVATAAGSRISYIAVDTPLHELARATRQSNAAAVFVSVSSIQGQAHVADQLRILRRQLEPRFRIAVGGQGSVANVEGVELMHSFRQFHDWVAALRDPSLAPAVRV
jgi:methanogenic corrinoid protein MtbC1